MTRKLLIAVLSLGAFAMVLTFVTLNPLRRSDAGVQRWVEKATPLGSSLSDVEAIARQRGWFWNRRESGGREGPWRFAGPYIRGSLGEYQGLPFRTSITVFWEFDASNRLTNIRIWRTRDAL